MKRRQIEISALIVFTSVLSFALGQNFNKSTNSIDQALDRIVTAGALDKSALERAAIEGMLRATGDRWSSYYDSTETNEESQNLFGRYSGVGIWLRAGIGGGSEISSLKKDSVAKQAGLKVGDVIILVDGADLSSASVNEAAAATVEPPISTKFGPTVEPSMFDVAILLTLNCTSSALLFLSITK